MRQDELTSLMHRAIDGALPAEEREALARALASDPLLKSEYEELQAVHAATQQLFRQIALPEDFSSRLMRKLHSPALGLTDRPRLPEQRSISRRRASIARMHRRQIRVYGAVAFVSAAAALVLAVGVVTGSFSRPTAQINDGRASQGGPGVEVYNRTDTSGPDSEEGEDSAPTRGNESSPESVPGKVTPETDADPSHEPENLPPAEKQGGGEVIDSTPDPDHSQPAPDKAAPVEPPSCQGSTVERDNPTPPATPKSEGGHGSTSKSSLPRELGTLTVLSGRIEALGADGNWKRLSDSQAFGAGSQLRTNVNGVAILSLTGTTLVLGKGSELKFAENGHAALLSGEVALDRPRGGREFELTCNDYIFTLQHGCSVVSRKLHSMSVRHAVGFGYVSHDQIGSLLLETACEAEIDYGKAFSAPKPSRVILPDWSGEARASGVLAAIDPALVAREWKVGERRYVDRSLSSDLERFMRHPVESGLVVDLLSQAIANTNLSGKALCQLVLDVEMAFVEETTFMPAEIVGYATTAAEKARDLNDWQISFKLLMHPLPPRPVTTGDCPLEDKNRRPAPRAARNPNEGTEPDPKK